MRNIIRKVLRENINAKFITTFHSMLASANAKAASMFGVHPDDWYLGTQIEYKWRMKNDPSDCLFYGSPDASVAEKMALFKLWNWYREDSGYRLYCDMINQYYDLDNFEIPTDDKTIYTYLDRIYNLVHLDTDIDIENYKLNPYTYESIFGYEYNDYDEYDDIGDRYYGVVNVISLVFNKTQKETAKLLTNWTMNKVLTDNYREV